MIQYIEEKGITHPDQNKETAGICLCCKVGIHFHFVIKNRHNEQTCWVGSSCIDKFLPHLREDKNTARKKMLNKSVGLVCQYCYEPLVDMRKVYQRDHLCDKWCYKKYHYTIPFGKHKKINLVEFIFTKKGRDWFDWVKKQFIINPRAFIRYPLFREIFEENEMVDEIEEVEEIVC